MERVNKAMAELEAQNVLYAKSLSYRKMCRWFSGFLHRHAALDEYDYYWRVEPKVR